MVVLRRLFAKFGYEPRQRREPESIRQLRRMAEQLNEKASRFRTVSSRAVLLEQRIAVLETDSVAWERRAEKVTETCDPELAANAARICGRLEGQLQETRAELAVLQNDEAFLRDLLTRERKAFAEHLDLARQLGHDVSGCLLYIDLTRPEQVADIEIDDEERSFVARVIDGAGVH